MMYDDEFAVSPSMRHAMYAVIVVTALASCLGRVATVKSKDNRGPFLSANDRSRWCTIRALVDSNTFVIDRLQADQQWQTIDKVQHMGPDGKLHFYSSKPPLLPTLLAGQYWLMKQTTSATFQHHPFPITRVMLAITNILPLALYFYLLVGLIERWCESDWARLFAIVAAAWGTFLTTLAVTLSNHLPAAICTLIALHIFISIWYDHKTNPWLFVCVGLAAAFTAANELPALSLLGLLGLALLWKDWKSTLKFGTPAVLLVMVAFFGLNFAAHGTWKPPYAHRHGEDSWYDYEGSHWTRTDITGVDAGEPSKIIYATNALVGHHGIFSLTPIWCLSVAGLFLLAGRTRAVPMPTLAVGIASLTIVCFVFYVFLRPEADRNYGGVSCGFRWMFWFTPLWLFAMLPTLDCIAHSKLWRRIAYACLAVSVFSAAYPSANPWQHPWPYQIAQYLGWV